MVMAEIVAVVVAVVVAEVVPWCPQNVRARNGIAIVALGWPIGTEDRATRTPWQRCRDSVDDLHPLAVPL